MIVVKVIYQYMRKMRNILKHEREKQNLTNNYTQIRTTLMSVTNKALVVIFMIFLAILKFCTDQRLF